MPQPQSLQKSGCPHTSNGTQTIVALVSEGPLANIIVNGLAARLGAITIIRESPESKSQIIRRRTRLLGWTQALGQTAFGLAQRLLFRSKSRINEILQGHGLNSELAHGMTIHEVPSVNSETCRRLLRDLNPSVVAVYGTRILKPETLASVAAPFINYHAGINPKYRGQHPGYWALASGDAEHAGITIHLVDQGVDTGHVLYQTRVMFDEADTIATYQYLQAAHALPLFARALADAISGRLNPKSVDLPSRQWFPPTLWAYLANGVTRGVW